MWRRDGQTDRLTCSYTVLCKQALCIAACCIKIVLYWHAEHITTLHILLKFLVFGWPFLKRFTLYYPTVVCLSAMSCLWCWCMVAKQMDQNETWHGGRPRPWPHCVTWGPSPPPFSAYVCRGPTAGWIKMPVATKVDLGPGHIVLDGHPAPPPKGAQQPPLFGPCLLWPNG